MKDLSSDFEFHRFSSFLDGVVVLDGLRYGQVPFQSENLNDVVHLIPFGCWSIDLAYQRWIVRTTVVKMEDSIEMAWSW